MEFFKQFDDANVRIEWLFWLPSIVVQPPEEFFDAVSDHSDDLVELKCLPEIARTLELGVSEGLSHRDTVEELCGAFYRENREGFIFQAATPVTSDHRPGAYTFSWGHYHTKWFYAPTLNDIAQTVASWADEMRTKDGAIPRQSPAPTSDVGRTDSEIA